MKTSRIGLVGLVLALGSAAAHADLLLAARYPSQPLSIHRIRESDGLVVGQPLTFSSGETVDGLVNGPDGRTYAALNTLGTGRIERGNMLAGGNASVFVGDSQGGYQIPQTLAFAGDGHLYAPSQAFGAGGTSGVMKFHGTTVATLGVPIQPGNNSLGLPSAVLAMAGTGDLLVSDRQRVNRYDKTTNAFVATFIAPGSGGLTNIQFDGASYGPDGHLYVPDAIQDAILKFDGVSGTFLSTFAASPNPEHLAWGADGNLYALSNSGIARYDGTTGASIGTIFPHDAQGPLPMLFNTPMIALIPEPTCAAMLALGSIALLRRARSTHDRA